MRDQTPMRLALMLMLAALAMTGPTIFLHESGHFLAGLAFGEDVWMTAGSVESSTPASDFPPLQRVVQTGMGPLVSVALALLGLALMKRDLIVGAALAIAAPARFVFSVGFLGLLIYRASAGLPEPSPSFDEYSIMSALALPVWPLLVAELGLLIWIGIRVSRALPKGAKVSGWLGLVAGVVAGGYLWLAQIGPLVFA